MKKFFAVLMALVLVLSMGVTAFAADETGTITISNAVKGVEYNIYKIFNFEPIADDTTKGRYTVVADWADFIADGGDGAAYLKANTETGTIEWVGEESDVRKAELARAAIDYAKNKGIAAVQTKKAEADGEVKFENVSLGYYAIDTSLGAICALTNVDNTFVAHEKNARPTLEKKIVEGDDLVDANNVAIGDTVDYQIKVTIGKGLTNYVVTDTMSAGLSYNDDAVVYIVDAEGNQNEVDKANYTVTENANGFTVAFDNDYIATIPEKVLVIKFSADLTGDAVVIGSTGNPNKAILNYKNENEFESTPEDTVITYTTELTIDKIDGDTKQPLKGAGFTLYKKNAEGVYEVIKVIPAGETTTTFKWTGLEEGEYKLEESEVPAGYNKIADIEFKITCTEPTEVKSVNDKAEWASNKASIVLNGEKEGTFKGEVENKTGALLPETGGIGTTIFYIVGITLMLGAAILLISKKKMAAKA